MLAHRAVYTELVGDPGENDLHHRCRNKTCVNPAHLEVVTRGDHIAKTFRPQAYRVSEQIDRYSIELIKNIYGAENDPFLKALEFDLSQDLGKDIFRVMRLVMRTLVTNNIISHCEWQVRAGKKLSEEEIGRRAIEIRRVNDLRVQAKNRLAELFGETVEHRAYFLPAFDSSNFTMDLRTVAERAHEMYAQTRAEADEPVRG